jgi:hypothetical protein
LIGAGGLAATVGGDAMGGAARIGCVDGMPIIVGIDERALRMTRPLDHKSSAWQPSQRTTA